jgi:hypothetical protein
VKLTDGVPTSYLGFLIVILKKKCGFSWWQLRSSRSRGYKRQIRQRQNCDWRCDSVLLWEANIEDVEAKEEDD